jgi:hypothetical protein
MVLEGRNNLDIDKWSMTSDLVVRKFDNALIGVQIHTIVR